MAKNTQKTKTEQRVTPDNTSTPSASAEDTTNNSPTPAEEILKKSKEVYAFPTKSRCPRCGSTDTEATSTQDGIQYRKCKRGICNWKYWTRGTKI